MRTWTTLFVLSLTLIGGQASTNDWPMLAHDSGRSGATATEVRPPFERKWYRLFIDEGIQSGVQPVIADGRVYLGTLRGILHALDAATGKDLWTYRCRGAILHAVAVADGRVFLGSADGAITALRASDGGLLWEVQTGSAVWNAPAVHNGMLLIGSRDQRLYAIQAQSGDVQWTAETGGPLLCSPAVDPKQGRVYVGSEDMRVYALDLKTGEQVWRTDKLPGVSLRGYHPVVAPDGSILVTTAPGVSVDTFQALLVEMAKSVFKDFASWRHSKEANAVLRGENFALMEKPESYAAQIEFIRKRLTEEPALQTFFVLDPATGQRRFVTPIVYSESMNGPGAPAVVAPDGRVIVKFQALLRSRYEHYSPFLNVGELDTKTGAIKPIMDQSRTYGWFDSLLLVHDEQSQLCVSGSVLINTHQDNVNGLDLRNLEGFLEPFCRNIHEPKPGEVLAIWNRILKDESLPVGKEWVARGTAVYGGGSVLDTAVSIVGDSFYYLPTHELNAGVALIAYRMNAAGTASKETPWPPAELKTGDAGKVQELPWDWDTLQYRRLSQMIEPFPAVPGTRRKPLTQEAFTATQAVKDADLDRIVWEIPGPVKTNGPAAYLSGLKDDLTYAVSELISREWRPLLFPSGKFPEESYRMFSDPTETLYTLSLAYPHLGVEVQRAVRAYVHHLSEPGGLLDGPVGQRTRPANQGEVRSAYTPPPEKLLRFQDDIQRSDLARLYPLWLWAHVSGDWGKLEAEWARLAGFVDQRPNKMEEDCRNGYIAGLIAFCRVADHMKDSRAAEAGATAARTAMRDRLEFEFAHTRGGLIWQIPKLRSAFSRWHFLTPEVGRLLANYVKSIHADLTDRYVDYHRPTWWLAWNVETLMRNECPYEFPSVSADIFAARALILRDPVEKLAPYIDRPWCLADEYYIQKLALTLDAALPRDWVDLREAGSL